MTDANDYYQILGVKTNATEREIRKAYRIHAAHVHPDKNSGNPDAHKEFLRLTKIVEVLTNKERRERYDMYGEQGAEDETENEDEAKSDKDGSSGDEEDEEEESEDETTRKAKETYAQMCQNDIGEFHKSFRGSAQEKEMVLTKALAFDGDMSKVLDSVLGATAHDLSRFETIVAESLPNLKRFYNPNPESEIDLSKAAKLKIAGDDEKRSDSAQSSPTSKKRKHDNNTESTERTDVQADSNTETRVTKKRKSSRQRQDVDRMDEWIAKCVNPKDNWAYAEKPQSMKARHGQNLFKQANRIAARHTDVVHAINDDGPEIDQSEWEAIQARLNRNATTAKLRRKNKALST